MRFICTFLVLSLGIITAFSEVHASITWSAYKNTRLGFEILIPEDFRGEAIQGDEPGHIFSDANGATISVFGMVDTWKMGSEYFNEKILEPTGKLNVNMEKFLHPEDPSPYAHVISKKINSYSIQILGQRGNKIFFEEILFSCADRVINALSFSFPAEHKGQYEALIPKLERRFSAGMGSETPICQ